MELHVIVSHHHPQPLPEWFVFIHLLRISIHIIFIVVCPMPIYPISLVCLLLHISQESIVGGVTLRQLFLGYMGILV